MTPERLGSPSALKSMVSSYETYWDIRRGYTKKFEEISDALDRFTAKKSGVYDDAHSKNCEVFGTTYAVTEIFNKVNRIITLTKNNLSRVNNESLLDSYIDLKNCAEFAIQYMLSNVSDEGKARYDL